MVPESAVSMKFGMGEKETPAMKQPSAETALAEIDSNIGKTISKDPPNDQKYDADTPLPDKLKKPWLKPGRYWSPTDKFLSPISQTLLAKNRNAILPPLLYSSPPEKESGNSGKTSEPPAS